MTSFSAAASLDHRLDALRAETPGTAHVAHFNHAGASLPPQPVLDAVIGHLQLEATVGGYEAHAVAHERLDSVYASIAHLLNAQPAEIALAENATRAWDMAVYSIPFVPGDRVLTTPWEYASNLVGLLQLAKHRQITIEVIPNTTEGELDLEAFETALRQPTAAVFITHMPTNGGLVQPAETIGALIRQHQPDAWYVLDACQTAGQLPLDVERFQVDILSATSRKYLRGPRGAGFLFVRQSRLASTEPPLLDLEAASLISATEYEIRPDARRFESWESSAAVRLGLGVAVEYALELGLEPIRDRVQRQADRLRNRLADVGGITVHDTGRVRGGIVTFSRAGVDSREIFAALSARKINTSLSNIYPTYLDDAQEALGTYIRSSVHYLTTDEEIEQLIDAIPSK